MHNIICYCPESWDDDLLEAAASLMLQLRPQYSVETLKTLLMKQIANDYRVVLATDANEQVVGIAGYVMGHKLAWGNYLYIDDLVVDEQSRGQQVGRALLDFCQAMAREQGCDSLHLDSGSQRHGAHKFYLGQGMHISSFHFAQALK